MDATPTRVAVLDDAARWAIEPMFSDFKGRGCHPEASQRQHTERLERLVLIWPCTGVLALAETTR
jgi:hypothetical protein